MFAVLFTCCSGCACKKNANYSGISPIVVDDSVKNLIGDTIASCIFEADSVKLLELSIYPIHMVQNGEQQQIDSLTEYYDCYIQKDFGVLHQQEMIPILFLLSDYTTYYQMKDMMITTQFTPNVALRFYKESRWVDIIFSFNGGMLRIYNSESYMYNEFKYTPERLVVKYFQNFIRNEIIQKMLNNNQI